MAAYAGGVPKKLGAIGSVAVGPARWVCAPPDLPTRFGTRDAGVDAPRSSRCVARPPALPEALMDEGSW